MSKKQTLGQQRAARVRAQLAAASGDRGALDENPPSPRNRRNGIEDKNKNNEKAQSLDTRTTRSSTAKADASANASTPTKSSGTPSIGSARLERARKLKEEMTGNLSSPKTPASPIAASNRLFNAATFSSASKSDSASSRQQAIQSPQRQGPSPSVRRSLTTAVRNLNSKDGQESLSKQTRAPDVQRSPASQSRTGASIQTKSGKKVSRQTLSDTSDEEVLDSEMQFRTSKRARIDDSQRRVSVYAPPRKDSLPPTNEGTLDSKVTPSVRVVDSNSDSASEQSHASCQ